MHIIQIQTIDAWKGAQEWSGKTILLVFSKFSCVLQGMAEISRECVAIVNQKRVIYWVINHRTMKYMLEKHDAWHGAMVCPHHALVKIWEGLVMLSCTPFINRTIAWEVPCFREGNHQDWRGIQILFVFCPGIVLRRTYTLQITAFKFVTFLGSFTIFWGLCAFSRH